MPSVCLHIPKFCRRSGGLVVQCSARDLKVAGSILAHGSFLMRGSALSCNPSRTIWSIDAKFGGII